MYWYRIMFLFCKTQTLLLPIALMSFINNDDIKSPNHCNKMIC